MITGFAIGWRVDGLPALAAGFLLLLVFAYAMAWLGVWFGLNVPTVEVGQQVVFTVLFPITFLSSAFVPLLSLPSWLQPFADWNPTSRSRLLSASSGASRTRSRRAASRRASRFS